MFRYDPNTLTFWSEMCKVDGIHYGTHRIRIPQNSEIEFIFDVWRGLYGVKYNDFHVLEVESSHMSIHSEDNCFVSDTTNTLVRLHQVIDSTNTLVNIGCMMICKVYRTSDSHVFTCAQVCSMNPSCEYFAFDFTVKVSSQVIENAAIINPCHIYLGVKTTNTPSSPPMQPVTDFSPSSPPPALPPSFPPTPASPPFPMPFQRIDTNFADFKNHFFLFRKDTSISIIRSDDSRRMLSEDDEENILLSYDAFDYEEIDPYVENKQSQVHKIDATLFSTITPKISNTMMSRIVKP